MCDAYITAKQAKTILNHFNHDPSEKRKVMTILLTRLVDPTKKFLVIESNLKLGDIEKLEYKMGNLFYFTSNNPTGHYLLNLENTYDRKVAQLLFHQNNDDSRYAMDKMFSIESDSVGLVLSICRTSQTSTLHVNSTKKRSDS